MTLFDRVLALMMVLLLVVVVVRWLLQAGSPRLPVDRNGEPEPVALQLTLRLEIVQTHQPVDAPSALPPQSAYEVKPIAHPYPPGRRIG
ncbi:MAG: hypothetical protein ACOY3E_16035 [Pseudomonadota bacterium]